MKKSDIRTRLRVMEMVTEIAAEATKNPNITWMLEFQELLVDRLYRKMIGLLEEGTEKDSEEDKDERDKDDKYDD
jgi:hypothetical protein